MATTTSWPGEGSPRVRLVRAAERTPAAAQQTAGMIREEALQTANLWAGIARTAPGHISGWHHHGTWDSVIYVVSGAIRLECGPGGRTVLHGEPGDYLFVPAQAIHREANPAAEEQTLSIVRVGAGPVVNNVEGPEPD